MGRTSVTTEVFAFAGSKRDCRADAKLNVKSFCCSFDGAIQTVLDTPNLLEPENR